MKALPGRAYCADACRRLFRLSVFRIAAGGVAEPFGRGCRRLRASPKRRAKALKAVLGMRDERKLYAGKGLCLGCLNRDMLRDLERRVPSHLERRMESVN